MKAYKYDYAFLTNDLKFEWKDGLKMQLADDLVVQVKVADKKNLYQNWGKCFYYFV